MLGYMKFIALSLCLSSGSSLPIAHLDQAREPKSVSDEKSSHVSTAMNVEQRGRDLQEGHPPPSSPPPLSGYLMKSAIDATNRTVNSLTSGLATFQNTVDAVNKEIADLHPTGVDEALMTSFTTSAKRASDNVGLFAVATHRIYTTMRDQTDKAVKTLTAGISSGSDMAASVAAAMKLFANSSQTAADELVALEQKITAIQEDYAKVSAIGTSMATTLHDHLSEQDGYLSGKEKHLREVAYGSCAGICAATFGIGCGPCYAAAIPTVETKISHMKHDMQNAQNQISAMAGLFDTISKDTAKLQAMANGQYKEMGDVASQLTTDAITVKLLGAEAQPSFWQLIILPKLEDLQGVLRVATGDVCTVRGVNTRGAPNAGYFLYDPVCFGQLLGPSSSGWTFHAAQMRNGKQIWQGTVVGFSALTPEMTWTSVHNTPRGGLTSGRADPPIEHQWQAGDIIVPLGEGVSQAPMPAPAPAPAKPCQLVGCQRGGGVDENHVCADTKSAASRAGGADWWACPYQMPGGWRWKPTFDADGNALWCSAPPDGEKGSDNELIYKRAEWQECTVG